MLYLPLANVASNFYNGCIDTQYFIIDFDSTFVTVEALDELATIALQNNPNKSHIISEIKKLTNLGMEGKISFPDSLSKRLALFNTNKHHIQKLIKLLQTKITPSVLRNKKFFTDNKDKIYIISGGFAQYIYPVVKEFGILENHVLANSFTFGKVGNVTGFDSKNPLSQDEGKTKAVKNLKLKGNVFVVGDGYTDYLIKKNGSAKKFFAFIENVQRPGIAEKAQDVLFNFDELIYLFNFPSTTSYPRNKIKVLMVGPNEEAYAAFTREGYTVDTVSSWLSEKELLKRITDVSVLTIDPRTHVTKTVLESAKNLLAIGRLGVGTANIALLESARFGIPVFNAPFSNIQSVSEMVIGEIIMLSRNVFDQSTALHKGVWKKSTQEIHEIRGKTLGIVGYDTVGQRVSMLAELLGMKVCFYDAEEKMAFGNAKQCETLQEVLQISDVISLHGEANSQNKNILDEKAFSLMKKGVIIINLSRGLVIDEKLLAREIETGKVKGAAIDVFEKIGKNENSAFISSLQNMPNVILTPHVGGTTKESLVDSGEFVSYRIIQFINTGATKSSINFPNLTLPNHPDLHRITLIYKNSPTVLEKLQSIFIKHDVHTENQYKKTTDEIGYMVSDITPNYKDTMMEEIKKIPGVIKARLLY